MLGRPFRMKKLTCTAAKGDWFAVTLNIDTVTYTYPCHTALSHIPISSTAISHTEYAVQASQDEEADTQDTAAATKLPSFDESDDLHAQNAAAQAQLPSDDDDDEEEWEEGTPSPQGSVERQSTASGGSTAAVGRGRQPALSRISSR